MSNFLDEILETTGIAIDIESTGNDWKRDKLTRIGFAYELDNEVKKISVHPEDLLDGHGDVDERFLHILENDKIKKIGSDLKFDAKFLTQKYKVIVRGLWFDTVKAAKLIDEDKTRNPAGLKDQAYKYMKVKWGKWQTLKAWLKANPDKTEVDYEKWLTEYNANDAYYTYILAKDYLKPGLKAEFQEDKFEMEMETVRVFYLGELEGIRLNVDRLKVLLQKYTRCAERVRKCAARHLSEVLGVIHIEVPYKSGIKDIHADDINYGSPKQIQWLLYEVLNYRKQYAWHKNKDGTRKKVLTTDQKALVKWARDDGHMFCRWLLFYRYFAKLVSVLEKLLNENIDGIKYQDYNTFATETARFSEHDLQCIPGRTDHGKEIRKCFVPNKTPKMWVADFSNVELRILAHVTRDPSLLEVYKDGGHGDLHRAFASVIFNVPMDQVTKEQRSQAKTTNFGVGYGMSDYALMNSLNQNAATPWKIRKTKVSQEEAANLIAKFYSTYSRVREWKQKTIMSCLQNGYVTDIVGRKRRVSFQGLQQYYKDQRTGILRVTPQWAAKEREAVNAPIQMSSASITKLAIDKLSKLGYLGKHCSIYMQVHDELVGDIYDESKIPEIKSVMESVVQLSVPLIVDIKVCDNWKDGK